MLLFFKLMIGTNGNFTCCKLFSGKKGLNRIFTKTIITQKGNLIS